jgi:hypothetical protein
VGGDNKQYEKGVGVSGITKVEFTKLFLSIECFGVGARGY